MPGSSTRGEVLVFRRYRLLKISEARTGNGVEVPLSDKRPCLLEEPSADRARQNSVR